MPKKSIYKKIKWIIKVLIGNEHYYISECIFRFGSFKIYLCSEAKIDCKLSNMKRLHLSFYNKNGIIR